MLRAVLFDLDGTMLGIDLNAFLHDYFSALGPVIAELSDGVSPREAVEAVVECTNVMCAPHPGRTNREVFHERFRSLVGVDLDSPGAARAIDRFYAERFPLLRSAHSAIEGAVEAVAAARDAGLLTAVATNPIFPRAAIDERMRWAGLDQSWFDLVTSYEVMHACKPSPEYFTQAARMLRVEPSECLMVGDDASLDMPAARTGMSTFYVGAGSSHGSERAGTLAGLPAVLDQLR